MIEKLNKISELEELVDTNSKKIKPIVKIIEHSLLESQELKVDIIEKYVKRDYKYTMCEPFIHQMFFVNGFTIISSELATRTEVLLETEYYKQSSSFLGMPEVFNLFINTVECKELIRNLTINTILEDE